MAGLQWGIVKVDSEFNMENFYMYRVPNWGTYNYLDMFSFDMYNGKLYFAAEHWEYYTNNNDNLTIYSINPSTGEINGAIVVESTALPSVGDTSYIDWYYLRLKAINGKLHIGSYLYLYNDYYDEYDEVLVFSTDFSLTSEEVIWENGKGSFPLSFKRYDANDVSVHVKDYSEYFEKVDISYLVTSLNESGTVPLYIEPLTNMPYTNAYEGEHFLVTRGYYGLLPEVDIHWEAIWNIINAENDVLDWLNNEVNMTKYGANDISKIMSDNNMTKDNYKEFLGELGDSGEVAEVLNALEVACSKLHSEALISNNIPKISSEAFQKLIELYGQYLENYPTVSGRLQLLYAMFLGE